MAVLGSLPRRGFWAIAATAFIAYPALLGVASAATATRECTSRVVCSADFPLKVARFTSEEAVEVVDGQRTYTLARGDHRRGWTFMGVLVALNSYAIFEDFRDQEGHMLFVGAGGVVIDLPKTSESNLENPSTLYLGHTREDLINSASDLLGNEVLSQSGDPQYSQVRDILPRMEGIPKGYLTLEQPGIEAFVGTPDTSDKIYFFNGGRTPNFDPAWLQPSIEKVRLKGATRQGLVGGYLPAVRFVYPESEATWTELIAFAPFRLFNGNDHVQPVWYRVSRIEDGTLKWSQYVDSYQPFPKGVDKSYRVEDARQFYADLVDFREKWNQIVRGGMKVVLPNKRVEDMALFSLIGSIMTRAAGFPKYGVPERGHQSYVSSEDDGFPDAFTDETDTMLEWGLTERAGQYIDNYLRFYVRDNGSLLYYGPETGQYGRMLAIFGKYLRQGGNAEVLVRYTRKIEGIVNLLLAMRIEAQRLPKENPAYGMLSGWSEADSSTWKLDPSRGIQPYFSNSAQAIRGFQDFGAAWTALGERVNNQEMVKLGERLTGEAVALRRDLAVSVANTMVTIDGKRIISSIAGVKVPPDLAIAQDEDDPQSYYFRVFMELLHSGVLAEDQSELIRNYLGSHHGLILGMPATFDRGQDIISYGLLSSGYGYSLIEGDHIREALLMLYGEMAHQYTRGTWVAPEERDALSAGWMGYSISAQTTVAALVRWLLVFEDPDSDTLWLGKGIPAKWLEEGQRIAVEDARTKWGNVSFAITSHAITGSIQAQLKFPDSGIAAETRLRLRTGTAFTFESVMLNGKPWSNFDSTEQLIVIPRGTAGAVNIVARGRPHQ